MRFMPKWRLRCSFCGKSEREVYLRDSCLTGAPSQLPCESHPEPWPRRWHVAGACRRGPELAVHILADPHPGMAQERKYKPFVVRAPDGVTIAAQEWGNPAGPEILFIHGFSQASLSLLVLRLCPADPGNPRRNIEGESPLQGKDTV
jgi:hypothetical protein